MPVKIILNSFHLQLAVKEIFSRKPAVLGDRHNPDMHVRGRFIHMYRGIQHIFRSVFLFQMIHCRFKIAPLLRLAQSVHVVRTGRNQKLAH
ncbi:Uncharacterised protein [Mycobacteroides abscessus subsp. massiliense]|nr:Uncharacterised protein [Mycobacteroides abscessus subsp. massiliense]